MAQMDDEALLSEQFAKHVLTTEFEDLPVDAIAQTKTFILDTLGVGIAGSSAFGAEELIAATNGWDSREEATLWGRGTRMSAGTAALVNAFQVHCQEYDCVHEQAVLHPMATLLPAALAHADRTGGISGRELIVSCATGVNVAAGLGIASRSAMRFFRPATAGGFGTVAAVGRLMGLSQDVLAAAFGLMYAQTSGTLQPHVEGSATLPLQVGFASRAALQACDLAAAGFPGTRNVFEGQYGYLPLYEGPEQWDLSGTWQALTGDRWLVSELSHKPYPAGRATHGGIEGLMTLIGEGAQRVSPEQVEKVTIIGPPVTVRLCARPDRPDPSPNYARLCMAYIGAKVLLNGFIDLTHYRGSELSDVYTHKIASRIEMISDSQTDPNALVPVSVEMRLRNGEVRTWSVGQMLASPTRRLSREQHLAKFRRCWEFSASTITVDKSETLVELVDHLENVTDVKQLLACLSP